jgi:hypothetical protein
LPEAPRIGRSGGKVPQQRQLALAGKQIIAIDRPMD